MEPLTQVTELSSTLETSESEMPKKQVKVKCLRKSESKMPEKR